MYRHANKQIYILYNILYINMYTGKYGTICTCMHSVCAYSSKLKFFNAIINNRIILM